MINVSITSPLAERLQELAKQQQRSVEDVLKDAVDRYWLAEADTVDGDVSETIPEPYATFADLARIALENPIFVDEDDVSERSREILNNEYADYLLSRLADDNNDEPDEHYQKDAS